MPFIKGVAANPTGKNGRNRLSTMEIYDLKQQARKHCPRALEFIVSRLDSKNERVALTAAEIILERGYGKPEQQADVNVTHKFAIVPAVMSKEDWLATKGDPELLPPGKLN
jgi:hypothetical protein